MTDEIRIHIAGKTRTDPAPILQGDTCPCGGHLEPEYGFGNGYGLGSFDRCDTCFTVYNFFIDPG